MTVRCLTGLLALAVALSGAAAQEKKAGKPKAPVALAGYKGELIHGFHVYFSDETQKHLDDPQYQLKPHDVIDKELAGIERVMTSKALALLRTVVVFVEWDQPESKVAGGVAVARYWYDGSRGVSMARSGLDPRKANNIEVLNMKYLTEKWQPGKANDQIVLLHELSHAVHGHLIGHDNPAVLAAYKQAMDRGLYDKVKHETGRTAKAYAATNDHEYFAELTCAYLDRCAYYPFTREELKEHDPVGYELMEKIWSKADPRNAKKKPAAAVAKADPKPVAKAADQSVADPGYDDPEARAERKLGLIDLLLENGLKEKARDRLNELIRTYPNTAAAKKAREKLKMLE
jgi:hypothetical protein